MSQVSNSFVLKFPFRVSLCGPATAAKAVLGRLSFIPTEAQLKKPSVHYHSFFASAVTVRLLSCTANISMPVVPTNKSGISGALGFVGATFVPTDVLDLASDGSSVCLPGSSVTIDFANATGLCSVLKGVEDNGETPTLVYMIESTWDATDHTAAFITGTFVAEFVGRSNEFVHQTALSFSAIP